MLKIPLFRDFRSGLVAKTAPPKQGAQGSLHSRETRSRMPQPKSGAAKLNELVNLKNTIAQKGITFSYCYG